MTVNEEHRRRNIKYLLTTKVEDHETFAKELEKLHADNVRGKEGIKELEQKTSRLIEEQIDQQNQQKVII